MDSNILKKFKFKLHSDMISCISIVSGNPSIFATGSRDRTILIWKILENSEIQVIPKKRLRGHSHFISDLAFSFEGFFCISSSWDKTMKLWNIHTGSFVVNFIGHKHDVLSVSFSNDNKQIISSSRDSSIKIWNTMGQCKDTFTDNHNPESWISCMRLIPNKDSNILICDWNGNIKLWNITEKRVQKKLQGHEGYVCCLGISPDSSLCASGGKDGIIMLWDLQENKHLYSLNTNEPLNCLCFSPNRYWLCAGTPDGVKIWDLESKIIVEKLEAGLPDFDIFENKTVCNSINWTPDGKFFLSGFFNGELRAYRIKDKT